MTKQLTDLVHLRNGATLNTRIVQPPMQTFSGLENGFVSNDTINYYRTRSQSAGMIIVEFTYVSENGGSATTPGIPEQLAIYSDEHVEGLRKIAEALKKDGNKAVLQIHHGGRAAALRAAEGKTVYGPSAVDFPFLDYPITAFTHDQVLDVIQDFGKATKRAIAAGFDGVEIHGANHYLLQQFFSAYSNRRTDDWGGSLEKRMAFPLAVTEEVTRVAEEYGKDDFIIGYRISPEEIHGENVGYTYKESRQLVEALMTYDLDYLHLSIFGNYNDSPEGEKKSYGQLFREVVAEETKIIMIGSIFDEFAAKDALNHADLVAVGRGTLMDPEFGLKIKEGRGEDIISKITPARLTDVHWTPGLKDRLTDPASGLPPLPNINSIR